MIFKNFRLLAVLYAVGWAACLSAAVSLFLTTDFIFLPVILILVSLGFLILLISLAESNNRRMKRFFEAISFDDFSLSFTSSFRGRSFDDLNKSFNEVVQRFRDNRIEKEEHYQYLLTIVEHISIGIIVFNRSGKVDLVNNALRRMLRIPALQNISELKGIDEAFGKMVQELKGGENGLSKIFLGNELMRLSIYATEFRMRGEEYMLVSIQNIHGELEENEIESWQKLTRVLTHEIMNSITPIVSLAGSMRGLIETGNTLQQEDIRLGAEEAAEMKEALQAIENRSAGLLRFVDIYRNLTRIPRPGFRHIPVRDLFNRAGSLLQRDLDQQGIRFETQVFPENLMVTADPDLVEQVLINLILNAAYALRETRSPAISMTAFAEGSSVYLQVSDNGPGIPSDLMDKIFIPFFTSKKDGSGIGLSLARQIMHLHKGTIYVRSTPGESTTFTLVF